MQYPDFSLNDKIAVVTGASKGIGYGLARAFANAGATVAVLARTESPLISLVDEITADGGKATPYVVDLRNTGAIPAVFDEIEADLDRSMSSSTTRVWAIRSYRSRLTSRTGMT